MTKQELKEELKQAMLSKDTVKTSVLRMVVSALGYAEIEKGGAGYEATNEDVMNVLQKEVKQHKDSIEQFTNAGREELAAKETKELEILKQYVPQEMDADEVRKLVVDAVLTSGATGPSEMGKVMSVLMPQIKGKADGGLVSKIVREELAK